MMARKYTQKPRAQCKNDPQRVKDRDAYWALVRKKAKEINRIPVTELRLGAALKRGEGNEKSS